MVSTIVQNATSKNDELLLLLRHGLPSPNRKIWYKADELHDMLKEGGLPSLPDKSVSNALKSNQQNKSSIGINNYQKKVWYCFAKEDDDVPFDTPKLQVKAMKSLNVKPSMPDNHFESFESLC